MKLMAALPSLADVGDPQLFLPFPSKMKTKLSCALGQNGMERQSLFHNSTQNSFHFLIHHNIFLDI